MIENPVTICRIHDGMLGSPCLWGVAADPCKHVKIPPVAKVNPQKMKLCGTWIYIPTILKFVPLNPITMILPREQALELLHTHVKNERMIAHSLASEVVMRALATRLGQDPEQWGQAGLLHDIDVETTNADALIHGPEGASWLSGMGVDEAICDAIAMHNEVASGKERCTMFQHALAAGETITGLITATAYVYPDRKVASVKPKSVVKRMKEKAFAASVKRENILECEKTGIPLDEFAAIAVEAMTGIAGDLGL